MKEYYAIMETEVRVSRGKMFSLNVMPDKEIEELLYKYEESNQFLQDKDQVIKWSLCQLFKVHEKNSRERCEICSMLTTKQQNVINWYCSGVFIVNFELISHLALVFL